ncbi:SAM-dependent methyltransferase [Rubrivivax gelatinosus]|uniref:SAM-dependent methyltransferase n=1 Tax=Rubrivivax gelatinosus TaxID=28068 RepID=A0ABS1DTS0_RUBGE|nr:class I SAM-dependent methyltransferase [Rubrivivax gelatinosus]MBK1614000.1 SAM-dependent methyltransferase [Rubrivivax gelatinosus]MBK1712863.1 SAM-dependent methyltransferase [Rubrivivax gelatinosus]
MPGGASPSDWLQRWAHLLPAGASVLDLACGSGRHLRWLAGRGHRVTGVDRDAAALGPLSALAETVVADLEGGPWPLPGRRFDAVLVTNYLWRPLFPALRAALADGGTLICETFAEGQQAFGRPSRSEFLLRPGELLTLAAGLHVLAYEDGLLEGPRRRVQRLVAIAPPAGARSLVGPPA